MHANRKRRVYVRGLALGEYDWWTLLPEEEAQGQRGAGKKPGRDLGWYLPLLLGLYSCSH